jgi:GNAT superfamily N-acetyltransferase
MAVSIRPVSADELAELTPSLTELLIDTVQGGASLGFLPPVTTVEARRYWMSILPEVTDGSRLIVGAFHDGHIAGSAQLVLPGQPNARHRAEVEKVFVHRRLRGQGVGRWLMSAVHSAACEHGRSLTLLSTRRGGQAERFYRSLGYREVGVSPGYSIGPSGERVDSVLLFKELSVLQAA